MKVKVGMLLEKYAVQFEKIRQVMADADKAYKDLPPEQRIIHSKRTRADYIADFFRSFVVKHLLDDTNIRILPYGSLRIIIKDECQLTFKKLNNNLIPSYIPKWFHNDKSFRESLKEMPKLATKLVAGYRWEPVGQSQLYLIQTLDKGVQWSVELSEPETQAEKQHIELISKQPQNAGKKVFPKGQLNKKDSV